LEISYCAYPASPSAAANVLVIPELVVLASGQQLAARALVWKGGARLVGEVVTPTRARARGNERHLDLIVAVRSDARV